MKKEKHIYNDEELEIVDGYVDEREDFLEKGVIPNMINWRLRFGATISAGLVAEFFCFLPGMGIWLYGNMLSVGVFKQMSMANPIIAQLPNTSNKEGFMLLLVSIAIVFFAIIGLASCAIWFSYIFRDDYYDVGQWYKKEIEKSKQICDVAVQDTEVELQGEINKLQTQLGQKQVAYDVLAKQSAKLQAQMKDNAETFKREKKLWALEKKELQYQIKLKQGLVDEMDDADSPLGGLYN